MPTLATINRHLMKLEALARLKAPAKNPLLDRLKAQPELLMIGAAMNPDPWQRMFLRSTSKRQLLLCSRQAGKSQVTAALALQTALVMTGSLTLLLSPTQRQSGELFRDKVMRLYQANGRPLKATQESALQLTLSNGSRIVSLPGDEAAIRGYSGVALLVVDEAARVPDALYRSVRPMLATSRGRLVCLSTPFGRRGFFFDEWHSSRPWERTKIIASQCPRISPEFLAEERQALGDRWYQQEYECSFEESAGSVFRGEDITDAFANDVKPLALVW